MAASALQHTDVCVRAHVCVYVCVIRARDTENNAHQNNRPSRLLRRIISIMG